MSSSQNEPAGRLALVVVLCSAALLALLAVPLVRGRVFVYNDLSWFHLPMRHLYQQALEKGDSLLWTPAIFSGLYLHGEGQTGVFHPLHLLYYRLLPLRTAFNLELLTSYVAAFAGTWWFLRRLRFETVPALFGAMLVGFSGFSLLHHHHMNMVAVVAHLPWLLAAADVLLLAEERRQRRLAFAAVALLLASQFLVGFPQAIWWNGLALAAFVAGRLIETQRWWAAGSLVAAMGIGILLGGIQVLPSADAIAHSDRAALSTDFALTYSLHPLNLLQLWSPRALVGGSYTAADHPWFHEFGIYSGAVLPVGLVWVWLRRGALSHRRGLITGATVFAAVMLVLALGRYGGLAQVMGHLPVVGAMRAPARYIMLVQFALAGLAAIALEDLLAIRLGRAAPPAGRQPALWIPALLGVLTTAALNAQLLRYARRDVASVAAAAPGVAVLALVTLLVVLAARRVRWAVPALIIVTAADLGVYGIGFVYGEPAMSIPRLMVTVQQAPLRPEDTYATAPEVGPYVKNLLVLRGYRLTTGYVGFFPAAQHPLNGPTSQRLGGTRWTFTPAGFRRPEGGGADRVRLLDPEGRAAAGNVQLTADRPGRLGVAVRVEAPAIVALTERFHHGWTATADGRPLDLVPVEGDFLGFRVDASVRQVELRFAPRSFRDGMMVSIAGVILLAAVLLVWPR
ncbi:MAG: hypothetical protein ABIT71_02800 [Vicinamibacteraceae bacterium]